MPSVREPNHPRYVFNPDIYDTKDDNINQNLHVGFSVRYWIYFIDNDFDMKGQDILYLLLHRFYKKQFYIQSRRRIDVINLIKTGITAYGGVTVEKLKRDCIIIIDADIVNNPKIHPN
jgi:hypothetical protein